MVVSIFRQKWILEWMDIHKWILEAKARKMIYLKIHGESISPSVIMRKDLLRESSLGPKESDI